ncbi:hypothetical protein [Lacticaseibacillus mingshuiensis]|uniref:MapZ extracellular domain-containing protein n=1 Tax=Lacticaseibacillus mingshuiensis TaxID=2799574 RepID=A0ABW4CK14_9LACO|nr:hypothetical protein [Lacticaseibacillus mingshuiensis]
MAEKSLVDPLEIQAPQRPKQPKRGAGAKRIVLIVAALVVLAGAGFGIAHLYADQQAKAKDQPTHQKVAKPKVREWTSRLSDQEALEVKAAEAAVLTAISDKQTLLKNTGNTTNSSELQQLFKAALTQISAIQGSDATLSAIRDVYTSLVKAAQTPSLKNLQYARSYLEILKDKNSAIAKHISDTFFKEKQALTQLTARAAKLTAYATIEKTPALSQTELKDALAKDKAVAAKAKAAKLAAQKAAAAKLAAKKAAAAKASAAKTAAAQATAASTQAASAQATTQQATTQNKAQQGSTQAGYSAGSTAAAQNTQSSTPAKSATASTQSSASMTSGEKKYASQSHNIGVPTSSEIVNGTGEEKGPTINVNDEP